ncbi:thy-1 membrane glycoprotein [Pimephales promelas]|nr:thy-1 membrane glycoprotein [Pimephales promelas]
MAFSQRETGGNDPLSPDYSSAPFTTRREPVRDLIHSLSNLYLENEQEDLEQEYDFDDSLLPPPPPPNEDDDCLAARMHKIECKMEGWEGSSNIHFKDIQYQLDVQSNRMTAIENQLQHILNLHQDHHTEIQQLEDSLSAKLEAGCGQVKVTLEAKVQDLEKATIDCLKRRDSQLRSLIQSSEGATSTPNFNHTGVTHSSFRPMHCQTPVKLEFPKFGSLDGEDPITYLERCDEYLAMQPLNDVEILSMLPSVLTYTAKDWWLAEKKKVKTWAQFKSAFLQSFLSEDHEVEVERRIRERKQGVDESIRTFAYQYRALCLRLKPAMTEREILQATLRNCNPKIASILRGTATTVDELVRVGTLIERDIAAERAFWRQRHQENSPKSAEANRNSKGRPFNPHIAVFSEHDGKPMSTLTLPITIKGHQYQAILDTGSTYSIVQESCWQQLSPNEVMQSSRGQSFSLANGHVQTALGKIAWQATVHGHDYPLRAYVMRDSDLAFSVVLGLEFLMTSGIRLDFKNSTYTLPEDSDTIYSFNTSSPLPMVSLHLALPLVPTTSTTLTAVKEVVSRADASKAQKRQLEGLMLDWPTVCTDNLGQTTLIHHRIHTTDEIPVRKKAYPVSVTKQKFIDEEVENLLNKGIIRPSVSPWAAPVVLVPKKDGSTRFCVDYRGLNAKTPLDGFPMPQIQDILESLYGATIFSTLDLKSGYWQVGMDEDSIKKTAFVTRNNQFEFVRLPFGLKNAAATFQRLMNNVLRDYLGKFCFVYLDDIVIYSGSIQDHFQHLKQLFAKLEASGLTLNLKKCSMLQKTITYLGHVISGEGVRTESSKIEAVRDFPVPKNVKEVQRFVGLASWYHRFIPHFSERAAPLYALKGKDAVWDWTVECQKAFDDLKSALQQAPVLMPPDFTKDFKVQTDASDIGLGAVLTQEVDGLEHVIAYASRLVHGAEKSYSTAEKECLAVVWAVEKWRQYLEGRNFEVLTDHSALTWVFNQPKPSSRLTRWALRLQSFNFTVKYRKGSCNVVPDALSRGIPVQEVVGHIALCQPTKPDPNLPVSWDEIGRAQKLDPSLQTLWESANQTNTDPSRVAYIVENDYLFRRSTPVVEPGYMLGVDLMGPFPRSPRSNEFLLVFVDYCSKWVELFALRSSKTHLITNILIKEMFTRWGTPLYLVSDRGPQFTGQLLSDTCKRWGVVQKLTTAYHPQTNLTERVNRTLKTMIASFVHDNHRDWDKWLPEFRYAINSAWQESTALTPAEIALGRKLKGPLERLVRKAPNPDHVAYTTIERQKILLDQVREKTSQAQERQAKYYNKRRRAETFEEGDLVWVLTHHLSRAADYFTAKVHRAGMRQQLIYN